MARIITAKHRGILALVLLTFGFASLAITFRYLSQYYSAFQQLYTCFGIAFVISFFVFPHTLTIEKLKRISRKDWAIMLIRSVVYYVLAVNFYREAITLTKIGNVTIMQAIPFTAVLGLLFFREKVTLSKIVLLATTYIGVLLVAIKDTALLSIGWGELLAMLSAFLFSVGYISRKWQTNFLNDREIAQIILALATIFLFVASFFVGDRVTSFAFAFWPLVVILITASFNILNIFLINYGFRNVPAVTANTILSLEIVFALIMAFIFYREIPSGVELLGCVVIVASAIGMQRLGQTSPGTQN